MRMSRWRATASNSVMIVQLNRRLADGFGELSKTLFFEYPTLAGVAGYLAAEHGAACARWTGLDAEPAAARAAAPPAMKSRADGAVLGKLRSLRRRGLGGTASQRAVREPIAIIGMSGRYPGARTIEEYWENLRGGKDCIGELDGGRWPLAGFYDADAERRPRGARATASGAASLRALRSSIRCSSTSRRGKRNIDPQERLFLQNAGWRWRTRGYTREELRRQHQGRVGVFGGYHEDQVCAAWPAPRRQGEQAVAADLVQFGGEPGVVPVEPARAEHDAGHDVLVVADGDPSGVRASVPRRVRAGDCRRGQLYLHPEQVPVLVRARLLSSDGRCQSFGEGGDGYVPGEGVGVVVLKPLSQAEADGDHDLRRDPRDALNHGGKTNGYTVPNPQAQKRADRARRWRRRGRRAADQLHRGARHGDRAWRPDRDHGTDAGVCAGHTEDSSSARSDR